jgi:hypothetical protein
MDGPHSTAIRHVLAERRIVFDGGVKIRDHG